MHPFGMPGMKPTGRLYNAGRAAVVSTMNWFKKTFGKLTGVESRIEYDIQFLGQQDGPIEQEIKARWKSILVTFPDVLRAYLAIASFDPFTAHQVVLSICSQTGEDPLLIDALIKPFREMFNAATSIDILFLDGAQEADVKKVCRAFYEGR
jgi:hypothetical protein